MLHVNHDDGRYSAPEADGCKACPPGSFSLQGSSSSVHCTLIGYPMTNELLFTAVSECKVESRVHSSERECSSWSGTSSLICRSRNDYCGCDATYQCPKSRAKYGHISTWDTSQVTSFNCFGETWCPFWRPGAVGAYPGYESRCADHNDGGCGSVLAGLFANSRGFNEDISRATYGGRGASFVYGGAGVPY